MEKKYNQKLNTLVIIGGGAAGLMAGVTAGEANIPAIILERRHRPGLKLLMCGNNRCNISHDASAQEMLQDYGGEMQHFLAKAIKLFPPDALRAWFAKYNLRTVIKKERIYPVGENADDVLHLFTDQLRELKVPMALNCPVASIAQQEDKSWLIRTENGISIPAAYVLLATGGLSYPKTGSVGDGQRMASELKHDITELKPGLAAMEIAEPGFHVNLDNARVNITSKEGKLIAQTKGSIIGDGTILRGSAIFDASRLVAHANANIHDCIVQAELTPGKMKALHIVGIRPIKEAITTAGGVSRLQINPETMESRLHPGLFFAGEVMDIDGPTGGYNLHAAFATARLALQEITHRIKGTPSPKKQQQSARQPAQTYSHKDRYQDPRSSVHFKGRS